MAQTGKLELQQEIKSSGDKMYELLKGKWNLLPQACPQLVEDIKVVKGDMGTPGSVRSWKIAGQSERVTDVVEAIDDGTKSITISMLDGEAAKHYKNVKGTFTMNGNMVKYSLAYDKDANIPDPHNYMELTSTMIKSLDAYLLKQ